MRVVDGEVEVFGVDEELGLEEALLDDVLGEEELVGWLEGLELGQFFLREVGIELVDRVTLLLHYLLAHLLQVVRSVGYLCVVARNELVIDLTGGEGIDKGKYGSKFFLLCALDVLPGEQEGHLADLVGNQRSRNFFLEVLELPDYVFIEQVVVVEVDDAFAGIVDEDVLDEGVVEGHLQGSELFLDELDVEEEDGPGVGRQLRVVEAVAAHLAVEEAVGDVDLAIGEVALVDQLLEG